MSNASVTCVLPYWEGPDFIMTLNNLRQSDTINRVFVIANEDKFDFGVNVEIIVAPGITSSKAMKLLATQITDNYILICSKLQQFQLGYASVKRMVDVCGDVNAAMVYSDYYEVKSGVVSGHPVIDYQEGSLRDDFNFGALTLYPENTFKSVVAQMENDFEFAALYDLRLRASQLGKIVRIPEYLYTEHEQDTRLSGQKMFDYVDPRNRQKQIEMEQACALHLNALGACLKPEFKSVNLAGGEFDYEASVIIPVKNRVKTIGDAIESVLQQQALFKFNCIVVDNHSTDGTSQLIKEFAANDARVIHVQPQTTDLGIGGCWSVGVNHKLCGRFAIQLDSDDLYIDEHVVKNIVEAFYQQKCAMVVGSYQMVNFNLEPIPPGIIDHKEWTPENGRNNALRINGLGAPRAFFTPILRQIGVPNVSYGEDYAVGLRISREYQIGRIYEPLYLCRRWDGNSDAALDVVKQNKHNQYKDKIRTLELWARQLLINRAKG